MDWKLSLTSFSAVFIAELGDKTQVATFALASGTSSRAAVFVGSAAALVTTSLIAVLSADFVARYISPPVLNKVAGGLLVVLGAWMLFGGERT